MSQRPSAILHVFFVPGFVLLSIGLFLFLTAALHQSSLGTGVILLGIAVGSLELLQDSWHSVRQRHFAIDYIALLAISTGLVTHEYLVAAVIVLMLAGGNTLEKYGFLQAKGALTKLANRIPHFVQLANTDEHAARVNIKKIKVNQEIVIRKGEVIPLDGVLTSAEGIIDESSLTGEPIGEVKMKGDYIRSGTVNIGNSVNITVTHADADSTYRKIIQMVEKAQQEKSPLTRLADQYSVVFTIVTVVLAGAAYAVSGDSSRVLAVLVMATPCPLILATPIALMGGVSAAARKRIIVKRLASVEILARVTHLIFDKTGTITLGQPVVTTIDVLSQEYTVKQVLSIAAAIERSSLHPVAKAIITRAHDDQADVLSATNVKEELGKGISGQVNGKPYSLNRAETNHDNAITLYQDQQPVAVFCFSEQLKQDAALTLESLCHQGYQLAILTGDTAAHTQAALTNVHTPIAIEASSTPTEKQQFIRELKKSGQTIAMIGDGINDAPALALADVGIVFSHEEQTAASEAADVVFLGGNVQSVQDAVTIARRTLMIAKQSIFIGIGLSVLGMIGAAAGWIPPLTGALLQEVIDVAVILNALRTSR